MSEEEIINKANAIIENHREIDKMMVIEMVDLVQGLLDLYYKEKEKSKELFETCCRYEDTLGHYECEVFEELDDYIKLDKLKELEEIGIKRKKYFSEEYLEKNFIHKDKIKELKKLVHKTLDDNGITRAFQLVIDDYFDSVLEE